jgi:hypothetical protein
VAQGYRVTKNAIGEHSCAGPVNVTRLAEALKRVVCRGHDDGLMNLQGPHQVSDAFLNVLQRQQFRKLIGGEHIASTERPQISLEMLASTSSIGDGGEIGAVLLTRFRVRPRF